MSLWMKLHQVTRISRGTVFFIAFLLSACVTPFHSQRFDDRDSAQDHFNILFAGDFYFGETYEGGKKIIERHGYDHGFEKIEPFLQQSDFTMVNLETPVTSVDITPYLPLKRWVHRGTPEAYGRYLRTYRISAVSLANNHVMDCGPEGLGETLQELDDALMMRAGAGMNDQEAARPLIRDITVGRKHIRLAVFAAYENRRGIDAGSAESIFAAQNKPGVNPLAPEKIAESIRAFRDKNPKALVIVFPHWGENYSWKSQAQTEWARYFIDAGADMIVGHGAHMLQEIETYKGKWIIYSLGNFIFHSPGRYQKENAWPYSALAVLIVSAKQEDQGHGALLRLYPVVSDNLMTGYQTRPVTPNEFNEILAILKKKCVGLSMSAADLVPGKNELGFYLEGSVR